MPRSVKPSKGLVSSKQLLGQDISWTRKNDRLQTAQATSKFAYVLKAIELTERYAKEQNCQLSTFKLQLDSDLDSPDGQKIWPRFFQRPLLLPQSKRWYAYYKLALTPLEIFQARDQRSLSRFKKNGSLGDIRD